MSKTAQSHILGFAPIVVILGITVLSIGAFFLGKSLSPQLFNKGAPQPTTQPKSLQIPSDWQQQTNQNFGISFMLPKYWDSVDLSDSLVIAPLDIVEDVRDKIAKEISFEGGSFLTMQVHILDEDYPPDTFQSDKEREITKGNELVGTMKTTVYTTKHLVLLPGFEEGSYVKTYLLEANGKKYSITLLDDKQFDTLQKIVASIKFTKPVGSELLGKTKDEVKVSKGEPKDADQNAKTKKEVWVYLDQDNDSTATYVYFLNDKVSKVELDEYNGTLEAIPWIK